VAVALSFNIWSEVKLFDKSIFDLLDYLTANLMLPIGGFGIAIFAGWVMEQQHTCEELELQTKQYKLWKFLVSYVAPVAVFVVFLHVVGII